MHVALPVNGISSVGAVALPGLGFVLRSDRPTLIPKGADPLRLVVSRTRSAPQAVAVGTALGADLVPMGSASAKEMAIVRGEADIYLHAGGQYEWDSAAPVAVATAYGLHCSRIDGPPMLYNQADASLPDLLICRKEQAAMILDLIA